MSVPELCIRRPVMATLLMVAVVIFGVAGYTQLPVSALPRVDFPTIQVTAQLPGASPENMASSVATVLERQFATIAGVASITSTSSLGVSQVTLQFDLERSIDGAALDVQSALTVAARKLPIEMLTPPSFQKVNPAEQPVLFISLSSDTIPLSQINEYGDTLMAQRISTLTGVAAVQIYGAQKFAVRVQYNPEALASRGIGVDEVKTAVAAATSNTPVGSLNGTQQALTLQATGQPTKAADYQRLIVAYRNGMPVRLSDVANIIDSVENDKSAGWFNGKRSIILAIQRQPDANTVKVVDSVKALVPIFRAQIPPSINIDILNDRSISIRESIEDVEFTLGLTAVLVVLVIFLFLRKASATIIPTLALPVSIIGTFAGMAMCGFSLDNISLLALTLAVGFVVDDAIVMLENIVRYIEEGMAPFDAALRGSAEIGFTIISITMSLIAVFIPVLFMGGVVGRLFREFAVTISISILVSGLVSLTLTPMLCSRFLKHHDHAQENWFGRMLEGGFNAVLHAYERTLRIVLKHRLATIAVTFATIVGTVMAFQAIPKGFFPLEDTGLIFAVTEASQDISFAAMSERQMKAAEIIAADPNVEVTNSTVGSFGASAINQGRIFIGLKSREHRTMTVFQVIQSLRVKLAVVPGINVFLQPIQNIQVGGRLSKSAYQYSLQGSDLPELYRMGPEMEARLRRATDIFQDVTTDLQISSPQGMLRVDRDRAATLGVDTDQIRNTLYNSFGARQVATIFTPANQYQVILEADPRYQQSPDNLTRIYVRSKDGNLVPMEAFASVGRGVGPLLVNHQGQIPSVTISFNLVPGVSLGQGVERIRQLEAEAGLPVTITTGYQGTAQVFQQAVAGQGLLLGAAILVIYIILGVLYESFIHPITILSGLPAAALGAILSLMLFKLDLSVIAIIGIIMLIGIVKKNAIMMIDFALERKNAGETNATEAIFQACVLRFRPIMMTTMAAVMGTIPIAVGEGAGSELRKPLGIAVVGGLVVSQLLTLYITPVVYTYMEAFSNYLTKPKAVPEVSHGLNPPPHAAE